ncbi:hypothetical protein HYR69_03225 [Candidatus Sumerlaeota bacterium]|nr:hypothetical protein [Candidatus Sumerlaeota bacterium]MBI3736230.1 hypothetical protein [Candidatus Sumerlaeota bacterium]
MTRTKEQGICEHCRKALGYYLIHNGFDESSYAYCDKCGMTALLNTYYEDQPGIPRHRCITSEGENRLAACSCGGSFRSGASPRCPHGYRPMSAVLATEFIEAHAARRGHKEWLALATDLDRLMLHYHR